MKGEFWINLPSKDIEKTRKFYTELGFEMNTAHAAPHMVGMFLGSKKVVLNIFPDVMFKEFIGGAAVTESHESGEVLFSLGADSVEEVDDWASRAQKAGARSFGEPGDKDGWMYGCGFADPDGHRWNILFMNMSKMPK
ncbi:VOC family protein [Bdellovibrio bacteriovorus]|uniref:VOC family protein n=1 Tax=Bdellovibrio bacteriovorus TaxID=959 RepID=UPI0035A65FB8